MVVSDMGLDPELDRFMNACNVGKDFKDWEYEGDLYTWGSEVQHACQAFRRVSSLSVCIGTDRPSARTFRPLELLLVEPRLFMFLCHRA